MTITKNGTGSQGDSLPMEFIDYSTNKKVRSIILQDSQLYFVARDVCEFLGLNDISKALLKVDVEDKLTRKLFGSGQTREVWLVNESGLYNLIFRSNKPQARAFKKWVTSEVLPQIRKTGSFNPLAEFRADSFEKDLKPFKMNGRTLYPYAQVLKKVGYANNSGTTGRRLHYGQHFVKVGDILYVTAEYAQHMAHSRAVYVNRAKMKAAQPLLPLNFGDTTNLAQHGNVR
jgi:hypothetical protein